MTIDKTDCAATSSRKLLVNLTSTDRLVQCRPQVAVSEGTCVSACVRALVRACVSVCVR